jgi:integrase/recombinase XerD
MLWLSRKSLNYNGNQIMQIKVAQNKQRKHNLTHANTTLGVEHMSQARVLTERELRKVLAHCTTQPHSARNRAMLLCTHMSGMRCKEVAALRICDVLGGDGQVLEEISLSAVQTKGSRARTVLVPRKLRDELTVYLQQRFGLKDLLAVTHTDTQHALFPTQKNPKRGFTPNTLAQYFLSMYKSAGIDGASSHSGRRSFATNISSTGTSIRVLMRLLGHQNISTTIGYVDASDEMLRKAVALA